MGRDLALERAWRKRMRQHERSGLTIRQFCKEEDLVAHQFSWWRRELKRRARESTLASRKSKRMGATQRRKPGRSRKVRDSTGFVPVRIQPSRDAAASIEIVLDQPPRIAVAPGFDAEVLREVVRVLESR